MLMHAVGVSHGGHTPSITRLCTASATSALAAGACACEHCRDMLAARHDWQQPPSRRQRDCGRAYASQAALAHGGCAGRLRCLSHGAARQRYRRQRSGCGGRKAGIVRAHPALPRCARCSARAAAGSASAAAISRQSARLEGCATTSTADAACACLHCRQIRTARHEQQGSGGRLRVLCPGPARWRRWRALRTHSRVAEQYALFSRSSSRLRTAPLTPRRLRCAATSAARRRVVSSHGAARRRRRQAQRPLPHAAVTCALFTTSGSRLRILPAPPPQALRCAALCCALLRGRRVLSGPGAARRCRRQAQSALARVAHRTVQHQRPGRAGRLRVLSGHGAARRRQG